MLSSEIIEVFCCCVKSVDSLIQLICSLLAMLLADSFSFVYVRIAVRKNTEINCNIVSKMEVAQY